MFESLSVQFLNHSPSPMVGDRSAQRNGGQVRFLIDWTGPAQRAATSAAVDGNAPGRDIAMEEVLAAAYCRATRSGHDGLHREPSG